MDADSKVKAKRWLASTHFAAAPERDDTSDDGAEADQGINWLDEPFESFSSHARDVLLHARPSHRSRFITDVLVRRTRSSDELAEQQDIVRMVVLSFARLDDTSRRAAMALSGALVERSFAMDAEKPSVFGALVKWAHAEITRTCAAATVSAPATRFALLELACTLLATGCDASPSPLAESPAFPVLLASLALALDSMSRADGTRPSLRKAAVTLTRRAIRNRPALILPMLAKLADPPASQSNASLIGLIVGVAKRLRTGDGKAFIEQRKSSILSFYTTQIVSEKTGAASHSVHALDEFIHDFVTLADLTETVMPTLDRMLVRQPEHALPIAAAFFSAWQQDASALLQGKLTPTLVNNSRSSNAACRSGAVALLAALAQHSSPTAIEAVCTELSAPIRTGKTSSADQRVALFAMLGSLPPSSTISSSVLVTALGQLGKETNEAAADALLQRAVVPHLASLLSEGGSPDVSALVKAMSEGKPFARRGAYLAVGAAIWPLPADVTIDVKLAKAFQPALSAGLKLGTAATTEALVSAALLLGPLRTSGGLSSDELAGLTALGAKPSLLLNERVYRRLSSSEEETWLVRALAGLLAHHADRWQSDAALSLAISIPLLHVAIEGRHFTARKDAVATIRSTTQSHPAEAVRMVFDGLSSALRTPVKLPATATGEDAPTPPDLSPRRRSILEAVATAQLPEDRRSSLLGQLLLVASHPAVSTSTTRRLWIDLVQSAGARPDQVVEAEIDELCSSVRSALAASAVGSDEAEAALTAVATLSIIAPELVHARLIAALLADMASDRYSSFTPTDLAIWRTSPSETFVDVLAATKGQANGPTVPRTNGSNEDRELLQWEAEVRAAQAKKKGAAATLSKADRALVDAQLVKEAGTRAEVDRTLDSIRRALSTIDTLVATSPVALTAYLGQLTATLLELASSRFGTLVAAELFATYVRLADVCTEQLWPTRQALAVATLRTRAEAIVPERWQAEALAELVSRVLYRLRFTAESRPVDAATYHLASPLVGAVIARGGLGLESGNTEGALEQVALAIDFISFEARAASDPFFPRLQMMRDLLHALVAFPSLSKSAAHALVGLGSAMAANATAEETAALLEGAMVDEAHVRLACLQSLQSLDLTALDYSTELWLLCHDADDERNKALAIELWQDNGLDVPDGFLTTLLDVLGHRTAFARASAARAIAAGGQLHPEGVSDAVATLIALYHDKAQLLLPEFDQYGMVREESLNREDPWRTRVAIAEALRFLAPLYQADDVRSVVDLLVAGEALGDRSAEVRFAMLELGYSVVDDHGAAHLQSLIDTFEGRLGSRGAGGSETGDRIVEAVVILLGRLARHLDPTDARLSSVVKRLVDALKTPSEAVQVAVGECLVPLVKMARDDAPRLIESLMTDCLRASKYADRRGAAYGLAGAVKGRGIGSLREFGLIGRVRDAVENKKDPSMRQGAVFAIEALSGSLGRIFEPWVIQVLPLLLSAMGDTAVEVREATQDAAKVIMSKISGHAVKLILPGLLSGLDDRQWRSKKGAVELLGSMAFLAPRQLSLSLPTIIPRLTEVLTDSHTQVRTAANASLKSFGEVVVNPEVKTMSPTLLDALVDPTRKTQRALDALLAAAFAHRLDSSSLALVVPILERAIRERSSDLKRKSVQIIGNLATLAEARDLGPYLSQLVPRVREVLVDPVPEARATAARALGSLVERLGEPSFPDLVEDLLAQLQAEAGAGSGIDQQGAAQGLSEVIAGLGTDRLDELLPSVLNGTRSARAYVREGFISLLVFLPATFGDRFAPYLARIIGPVLLGLADESEFVRDASLKAGRMVVSQHSESAKDLLLPELERGLFDGNFRIRQSSMQLIGELLFRLVGITARADQVDADGDGAAENADEDAPATMAVSKVALVTVLGQERRDRVLAAIYIARQDPMGAVRNPAVSVWKTLVQNTPRTVKEILPMLMQLLVRILAAPGSDQRDTAARTLGELCRKLGDGLLPSILPVLQQGQHAPDARTRQGIQLALVEIMAASDREHLAAHDQAIVAAIRTALVDDNAAVRQAAATSFDAAQNYVGPRAIDDTVPALLAALDQSGETAGAALAALQEVMRVRADKVSASVVPALLKPPISVSHAKALSALVRVAGGALSRRLPQIIDALAKARADEPDAETVEALSAALATVLAAVTDGDGLHIVMMHLLGLAKHPSSAQRASACDLLKLFCASSSADHSSYAVDWIRQLVPLLEDRTDAVVRAAHAALEALVAHTPKDELETLAVALRRSIEGLGVPGQPVAGLELGLKPVLPALLQGLLVGTSEQREASAYAFGDLVDRMSADAFRPHVAGVTGPLIRVVAERHAPPIRAAIFSSLAIVVRRAPAAKAFYPQLQRTFSKALADPSPTVRARATAALSELMALQPRIDPLVTELLTGARVTEEREIRETYWNALAGVVRTGGANLSATSRQSIAELVHDAFTIEASLTTKESFSNAVAAVLVSIGNVDAELVRPTLTLLVAPDTPTCPTPMHSIALRELVESESDAAFKLGLALDVVGQVQRSAAVLDAPAIARPARDARDLFRSTPPWRDDDEVQSRL